MDCLGYATKLYSSGVTGYGDRSEGFGGSGSDVVLPLYFTVCQTRFLCGAENAHRKQWIEDRLQELARIFAIDVCGFAILDNRLHVLLRLGLAKAKV